MSIELELDELADVMVSDVRGVVPFHEQGIPTIVDARRRLLKPGGAMIPLRDTLWAAPVEAAETYRQYNEPWRNYDGGLKFEPARTRLANSHQKCNLKAEAFLAGPALWATLDYQTIENALVNACLNFVVSRAGTLHGFVLWFDAELAEGIAFSNAPGQPKCIYGQLFLPLLEPLQVTVGQAIQLDLRASHVNGDYIWRWNTRVLTAAGECLQSFNQSTFSSLSRSPTQLRKMAAGYQPCLNPEGLLQLRALELMREGQSLDQAAAVLLTEFPRRFPAADDALGFLGGLSVCYSL
jgi:protein arginine N-methyltransferase 1